MRNEGSAASPVHLALCRATAQVELEMGQLLADEGRWDEEYITQRLCMLIRPEVTAVRFNRPQERQVGADYIWWWVDRSGESFGCLIQAKNIKRRGRRSSIDFQYGDGRQMQALFQTADLLRVPAGYMLYAGDRDYQAQLGCMADHSSRLPCYEREGAAVTLVPALLAERVALMSSVVPVYAQASAAEVFCQWAKPLIDFTASKPYGYGNPLHRIFDLTDADPGLREFLSAGQVGARKVARHIFDTVLRMASMQFSAVRSAPPLIDPDAASVFPNLPGWRAHFRASYFEHTLRGLRHTLPTYVEQCLAGDPPPEIADRVAGIIVVRV